MRAPCKAPRRRRKPNPEGRAAALLLLPSLLGTAVFVLLPFAETVRRSFCDARGRFAGFANYRAVLGNAAFQLAARNTARFLCSCVPILLAVSLLLALGVRVVARRRDGGETARGRVFRTSFLLPMAIPVASIVVLWQALFAENGLVNAWLGALGAPAIDWMGSSAAFWVLVLTYVWKNAGYDMILWLAGLDGIGADLYEAASVDGANAWQKFWQITLPNLRPTFGMVGVLSVLNSFKAFREAFLVGGNYPDESMYPAAAFVQQLVSGPGSAPPDGRRRADGRRDRRAGACPAAGREGVESLAVPRTPAGGQCPPLQSLQILTAIFMQYFSGRSPDRRSIANPHSSQKEPPCPAIFPLPPAVRGAAGISC